MSTIKLGGERKNRVFFFNKKNVSGLGFYSSGLEHAVHPN